MIQMCLKYFFILFLISKLNALKIRNPYRNVLELLIKEPQLQLQSKSNLDNVDELWIEQKLDHFDDINNQTWQMRYYRNEKFYKTGGPIFIFIGGEWSISPYALQTGLMYDMARLHHGIMYYTEHRYYGESWPVSNLSTKNLRFLSLKQALADLAHFIKHIKPSQVDAKVILVGGSYAGSIATWMTHAYPELITASWATSAPLLAKADFYEYMKFVSESITLIAGAKCSEMIELGMQNLAHKMHNKDAAQDALSWLNPCSNFNATNMLDRAALFNGIGNYFALLVQSYSRKITAVCEMLLSLHAETPDVAFLRYLHALYAPATNDVENYCQDFSYAGMLALFRNTKDTHGTRQWFYQTCTEFGWYTTTKRHNSSAISFGNQVPLHYFERLCVDAFGDAAYTLANMSHGIHQTNIIFGGNNFTIQNQARSRSRTSTYNNVYFTHGQLDPWRAVGQHNEKAHNVRIITGYSHCADLSSINLQQDTLDMHRAKLSVLAFLRKHIWRSN